MIKDEEAEKMLIPKALELIKDADSLNKLGQNIRKLAQKDSAERIAAEVLQLISKKN